MSKGDEPKTILRASARTLGFETRAIHVGQEPDPATGAVVTPVYQTSTYAQAGVGPAGTFPRQLPVLHIDHVLVGPRLRAAGFSIADPGAGRHSAAVAEIVRR